MANMAFTFNKEAYSYLKDGMTFGEALIANGHESLTIKFWDWNKKIVEYPSTVMPLFGNDDIVFDSQLEKFIPKSGRFYYGIRPVWFIWRGTWADPELEYKGTLFNEVEVNDHMRAEYEFYLGVDEVGNEMFDNWMKSHDAEEILLEYMEDLYREKKMEEEE